MHVIDSRVLDGESSFSKKWDFRDPSVLAEFLIAKCASNLNSANIENLSAGAEGPRSSIFSVELYRFDIDPGVERSSSVRSLMMGHWSALALSEGIDLFKEPEVVDGKSLLEPTHCPILRTDSAPSFGGAYTSFKRGHQREVAFYQYIKLQ